jgi:ATP/maltotriose-dependent transcriptional regulator MalT/DNA-binding SARP family transcriptional activator
MLDDAFCDPLYLLVGLVRATASWLPDETHAKIVEVLQGAPADVSHLLRWELDVLGQQPHSLLLVLDDVHVLQGNDDVLQLLTLLISQAPRNLRVVLASRSMPMLPSLHKLRAQGQVLTLDLASLRFTTQEVKDLFHQAFDVPLSEALSAELTEQTEGWPVALSLIYQTSRGWPREDVAQSIRAFAETPPQLYDYLASVVLKQQPIRLQRFLLRTSILNELHPGLCDKLTGRNDASVTLARLERQGLFTIPLDDRRKMYRYHGLFRDFLRRCLKESESSHTIRRLHSKAAGHFLRHAEDESAIRHLLAAGDYGTAADLIHPLQERLFHTSRYHMLEHWFDQFPPADVEQLPWILTSRARIATIRGNMTRAQSLFHRAESLLKAQDAKSELYNLYRQRGYLVKELGNFKAAEQHYLQALDYAVTDAQRSVALGWVARCRYVYAGEASETMVIMNEAVALAKKSGHLIYMAELLSVKGRMLSSLGDFIGALGAWRSALDLMETYGNQHRQIGILNNMAYHHVLLGDFEQANTLNKRAIKLAELYGREGEGAYALNIQGCIHASQGRWDVARGCYEEALAIQRRANQQYEIPVTLNWLATLARHEGNLAEALRLGREGLALREEQGNDYEIGLSLIDLGAIHLALDHLTEAERLWRRAMEIFERHEARYERSQLHFYLAVLALRESYEARIHQHLSEALRLAQGGGHLAPSSRGAGLEARDGTACFQKRCFYFFVADSVWTVPLLVYALRHDFVPDCVDCLLVRLGKPALEALVPLLDDPSAAIRARAARLLGSLGDVAALEPLYASRKDVDTRVEQAISAAQEMLLRTTPEPLRVQTLGNFRLWRGGGNDTPKREIVDWPRKSARDVFVRLLLESPQPVGAEVLAEALWPNSPPDKSAQSLRRAISDLRHTLEPELPSRHPSRYVLVSSETYALNLPPGSHVTDIAFEEDLTQALNKMLPRTTGERRKAIEALETILSCYTGDYVADLPFEEWTLTRREYLRNLLLRGMHRLARLHLEAGDFEEAIAAAHAALAREPWDEEATHILMKAYAAFGHIPSALRAYEMLRDRLKRDLDLPPREDLTALYHRLRR